MIRRQKTKLFLLLAALLAGALTLVALFGLPTIGRAAAGDAATPEAAVVAAWQRVQQRGAYEFSSDVVQTIIPDATLANIGRSSREERLYLEGESNLRLATMDLKLWSDAAGGGGSSLVPESGIEVQVADGKTRTRSGGGAWEDVDGLIDGYAPQGDFLAYLAAMRDVNANAPESRAGVTFTRYTFVIDGPVFATYARDQLQRALQARGELPPGMELSPSPYYAGMTGTGELWVAENGLPLRQILKLQFPVQRQERASTEITVNFRNYGEPVSGSLTLLGLAGLGGTVVAALPALAMLTVASMLSLALVFYRRQRHVQNAAALTLCFLMVVSPALSSQRTVKFLSAQNAEAAAQESQREEYDAVRAVRAQSAQSTYDPHANPLAAVDPTEIQSGIALAIAAENLDTVNAWNFAASPAALTQWATTASASSQYGSPAYGAVQATGAPNVASCGDSSSAWAPLGSGSGAEWLRLGYATPVYATGVRIHETYIGSFVTGLDLVEPNGTVHALSVAVDSTPCPGYFELSFSQTSYLVSAVVIHTQAPGWEEIDAVELAGSETPVSAGGDSDGDGISDGDELAIGTDPNKPDTDGDGLTDFQEVSLGTDPTNFDTDGDQLSDGEEVKPFTFAGKSWISDPLQADTNKDGLSDMQERTPDFNGDGLPDRHQR